MISGNRERLVERMEVNRIRGSPLGKFILIVGPRSL